MTERPAFAGDIGFITLADIFQILGGNNSTGVLYLKSPHTEGPGVIYFSEGKPINAAVGSLYGKEAIYALFGWREGSFEFRLEPVHAGRVVEESSMQIILDALRMLDDGQIPRVGGGEGRPAGGGSPILKGRVVDYMYVIDEEVIPDGETVVREGAHGKWIWVILEGSVKVSRETGLGTLTVARLGQGSFIGTIGSFLFSDIPRSATVIAQGDVRLGLLDSQRLHEEYSRLSPDLRTLLISAARRLQRITDRAVALHSKRGKDETLPQARMVVQKGTRLEEAFFISRGKALLLGEGPGGAVPLLTLDRDDVFGFLPFLDLGHEPLYASVLGSGDLETRQVDIFSLKREYDDIPGTLKHLIEQSCHSVAMTTRLVYQLMEGKEIQE
ncbi:MAG: cyclic nucleotide-binding domain-containing protein [Deltaproteobacteria bacterium]|nr:cyclic nucleotide-binding domain-containing protein [Deltaproteobacteria bacterium]MBW2017377.1 cyclic nucleotide-binding domain-containing protein [Deltaproteobacteria bacterium]MBW2128219.1 cyclic nucleotide-binding domain-containing protein [Deltaproteobacteria bacterium]MBW2303251.1 cyclic nucleotide-binding domain-containing protein [Deltaproteobacteria bacterium]